MYYNTKFVAQLFVNAFSLKPNDKCSNGAGVRIRSDRCNAGGMNRITGRLLPSKKTKSKSVCIS
jgi:hypothetical protein